MDELHPPGSRPGMRARRFASVPAATPAVGRALPVRVQIAAVDLRADVTTIGLRADGNLDVPTLTAEGTVCWYRGSPTPGEPGTAVFVGHVDPRLRLVRPGDQVEVGRADGSALCFVVSGIAVYPKDHFPGDRLLGPRDYPALALMTSGGVGRGGNLIVFARHVDTSTGRK